jgi:hypothetical protein
MGNRVASEEPLSSNDSVTPRLDILPIGQVIFAQFCPGHAQMRPLTDCVAQGRMSHGSPHVWRIVIGVALVVLARAIGISLACDRCFGRRNETNWQSVQESPDHHLKDKGLPTFSRRSTSGDFEGTPI